MDLDVSVRLTDLAVMHPRLLWDEIGAALAAVITVDAVPQPRIGVAARDVPGFGDGTLRIAIAEEAIDENRVAQVRRTYEPARLVELAAIAVAGIALYHAGGHEIRDVALHGSGADYLVGEPGHLLEIAGRSRRADFGSAWQQREKRLAELGGRGCYLCVVEFETPAGRLAFRE